MAHDERLKYRRGKKAFGPYHQFLKIHSDQIAVMYTLSIDDLAQEDRQFPTNRPTLLVGANTSTAERCRSV
jgi:hypothetical protein